MMKRYLIAASLAALLAGCGSSVKLDDTQGGSTTNVGVNDGESAVTGVQATDANADGIGPVGVGKIVYFDFDSFVVKPEYQSVVEGQAKYLAANRGSHVMLEGHTDARGSSEYNLALGQKRAEAVRRALNILGVGDTQLEAISYGKEKPAAHGTTEDDYAQNRRVEFSYRR
ncbi:MAG: peptidoglycan-associated lipoprotein Pal [Burkholderiaceae bacterium]|jgi:peptidoglycan-associated lipoprotein|nr:peptidoglycan-associated lipoprotein Pal [Burkholderiaceae bacterium]